MGERRRGSKLRNMSTGLGSMDNGVGIDCGAEGAGESNGAKGGTTVMKQQKQKMKQKKLPCFAMQNAYFFAHIFKGKIRMHVVHG